MASARRVLTIKVAVTGLMALQGILSGVFFPEGGGFWLGNLIPDRGAYIWLFLFMLWFMLAGSTVMYFLGPLAFSRYIPAQMEKSGNFPMDKIGPYLDFSWFWFMAIACSGVSGLVIGIGDAVRSAPHLGINLCGYFVLTGSFIVLNYCFCARFCDERQKQYSMGLLVNAGINFLLRRPPGTERSR